MAELSSEEKKEIVSKLKGAGAILPCPRCGNPNFTLVDGYFNHNIQTDFGNIVLGGPSVPTIVLVCDRCGFLSQHALGVLGLLSQEKESTEAE